MNSIQDTLDEIIVSIKELSRLSREIKVNDDKVATMVSAYDPDNGRSIEQVDEIFSFKEYIKELNVTKAKLLQDYETSKRTLGAHLEAIRHPDNRTFPRIVYVDKDYSTETEKKYVFQMTKENLCLNNFKLDNPESEDLLRTLT